MISVSVRRTGQPSGATSTRQSAWIHTCFIGLAPLTDVAARVTSAVVQTKTLMVRSFSEQKLQEQESCPIEPLSRDYMSLSSSFLRMLRVRNVPCSGFGTQHGVSSLAAARTFPFQGAQSRPPAPPAPPAPRPRGVVVHVVARHHLHVVASHHLHGVDVAAADADAADAVSRRRVGVAAAAV